MQVSSNAKETQESPARSCFAVTPHDTDEVGATQPRALYIGGAGDLVLIADGDTASVTFVGLAAGTVLPVKARIVLATGTTATSIVAMY